MGTDSIAQRRRHTYMVRLIECAPTLVARVMRKDNLFFRSVRALDTTEAVLTQYLETMPVRHAERFEQWWNDTLHVYNDG